MKRTRYLVTGGAGFIGSHLCQRLLERGNEVICIDNFYTGRKENIADLRKYDHFESIRHDICFPLYIEVDAIFNLACPASPIHYQYDPVQTVKTNVVGAIHMLGLAKRLRIPILQASTSEVYGDPEQHPQNESYRGNVNFIGRRACYDEGKRCVETAFFDYHRQHDIDIRVARIFNTYGPRMNIDDGRVVSNFICQSIRNEPITLYGSGNQTRSFCYVDDMVDGLMRLMESENTTGIPVNLGNPDEVGISDLASEIVRLNSSRSELVYKPLPDDDPKRRCPDISRARELLDWEPVTRLTCGLESTISYFQSVLR